MLWAIDVSNSLTKIGLWDGTDWKCVWRITTRATTTEDELAAELKTLCDLEGVPFAAEAMMVGSVVPMFNESWKRLGRKYFDLEPLFLLTGEQVGMKVRYNPPHAVGADRIANAIAALQIETPPVIVVDFGTATTFDVVGKDGDYLGGAILPGVFVSMQALLSNTAKLPQIELHAPSQAIGTTTTGALQSGIVLGHAAAVDALAKQISAELGGGATVLSTGGLGRTFVELCDSIDRHEPTLTLDGLRLAHDKLSHY